MIAKPTAKRKEVKPQEIIPEPETLSSKRQPLYRRDINPTNLVLSASDLFEFSELIFEINKRAIKLEIDGANMDNFDSAADAKKRIRELMQIDYHYMVENGDSVEGLGLPKTDDYLFPDKLKSFYISNSGYAKRTVDQRPMNTIDAFLGFETPSLKIDLITLPSNPTENRSVINVNGRNEDWVISSTERINDFFEKRRTIRPAIHGSGAYDYFVHIAFLPVIIWILLNLEEVKILKWLEEKSIFINIIVGIYAILTSLLLARFLFQYIRWLFPPIEYYKKSRIGSHIHRTIAGVILASMFLSATYDIMKSALALFFE